VDIEGFARPEGGDAVEEIDRLISELRELKAKETGDPDPDDSFARDPGEAADGLEQFAAATGPRVIFVGKTIVSKGCDLLLAAWPAVVAANPGARLLMVGFGAYRDGLEELWAAISSGDLEAARALAELGWGREGGEAKPLPILSRYLADPPEGWAEAGKAAAGSVAFSGRLDHSEVGELLPATDAMVVPSTFPEAFGMVAAEAAAAGALPVCADHSGLAEVAAALDERLPAPAQGLTAFPLDDDAVDGISSRLNKWLALPEGERAEARASLAATVADLWSWQGVAKGVLAASAGELDGLPRVPGSDG
jgi:glycosyltransferase involved in cell wall biosynthesis